MRLRPALAGIAVALVCRPLAGQTPSSRWQWPVARPAAVGLDSATLAAFDADLAAGKYGQVDEMLVIRHGQVAWQRHYQRDYAVIYGKEAKTPSPLNASDPTGPYNYFNPWWHPYYRGGDLHSLQSVTKTVTSVTIGVAVTRGDFPSIDTPALRFFDTTKVANLDARKRRMTIRHLLTMTAGLDWNENLPYIDPANTAVQLEASPDWVEFTINRPMAEEPGTRFNYSSGVSALLAHIFHQATGRDIEEYAAHELFQPLDIEDWHWKRSPRGLIDTEGGLYLTPGDLAKIWQMFLQGGRWQGRQIVSQEWVAASVTPAVTVGQTPIRYGLKWWLAPYGPDTTKLAWAGSGFGGQLPIAIPEYDLVMVFNGWNVLPDRPALTRQVALQRVLAAVR